MNKRHIGAIAAAMVGLVGCHGGEPEEGSGFLLLDREAREAGFAIEGVTMDKTRAMPVEIDPESEITLVGRGKRVALAPEADQLLIVHGKEGVVEPLALGAQVDPDRLIVRGTDAAANELAEVLAGEITSRDEDVWEIHAENALAEASRVRAPAGLLEISPGFIEASLVPEGHTVVSVLQDKSGVVRAHGNSKAKSDLHPGAKTMVLLAEALMPPAVSCDDPVAGTWLSHQYHPKTGKWHHVTVHVARDSDGAATLNGEIRAEFWQGSIEDMAVPGCDSDIGYHGAVRMPATGVVDEDHVEIHGTSWATETPTCERGWRGSWIYRLDNFSGTLDGASLHAVNNDGGTAVNEPNEFRRVSCE